MSRRKSKTDTNYAAALMSFMEKDRSFQADMATTLAPDDKGHLPKAFRGQKLDPANPWHWRQLLEHFAAREYGDRSAGRPKISHKKKSSRPPYCCVERHWLGLSWRKNTLAVLSLTVELRASLKIMGIIPLTMRNHYDPDLAKLERC